MLVTIVCQDLSKLNLLTLINSETINLFPFYKEKCLKSNSPSPPAYACVCVYVYLDTHFLLTVAYFTSLPTGAGAASAAAVMPPKLCRWSTVHISKKLFKAALCTGAHMANVDLFKVSKSYAKTP